MGCYAFLLILVTLIVVSTAAATDSKESEDSKDYVTEVMLTFQLFGVEISTQQKITGNLTRLIEHIQQVNIKGIIIFRGKNLYINILKEYESTYGLRYLEGIVVHDLNL